MFRIIERTSPTMFDAPDEPRSGPGLGRNQLYEDFFQAHRGWTKLPESPSPLDHGGGDLFPKVATDFAVDLEHVAVGAVGSLGDRDHLRDGAKRGTDSFCRPSHFNFER